MHALELPPSRGPGLLLGLGLGGFADGILLHQIMQWHNMGSAVVPPATIESMSDNMRWDGFFHAAVWLLTVIGMYWLAADARSGRPLPSGRMLTGLLVLGWGLFNLVEGIVDHHLLGLHHVRDLPAHVPLYDWLFLAFAGVGFIIVGRLMAPRLRAS